LTRVKHGGKNSKKRHTGKGDKTSGEYVGIIDVATGGINFELNC
jgi:hypothetical protein